MVRLISSSSVWQCRFDNAALHCDWVLAPVSLIQYPDKQIGNTVFFWTKFWQSSCIDHSLFSRKLALRTVHTSGPNARRKYFENGLVKVGVISPRLFQGRFWVYVWSCSYFCSFMRKIGLSKHAGKKKHNPFRCDWVQTKSIYNCVIRGVIGFL